uniref:Uncharacterized protein n=1 Tax=Nelumbo nucifera TaxID=4432 RepID=A0A822XNW8_NELNU|nr:TPA_asm: hypothetical protein HUJ06_024767 [Nelumbo nucifera]
MEKDRTEKCKRGLKWHYSPLFFLSSSSSSSSSRFNLSVYS